MMETTIGISVIVPVYNVEKYLGKCLDSVLNQTFQNFELVIVNDGSTDASLKIINEYLKKYPDKIRAFDKKNGGLSSARNFALEKARGEYITFLDSDDYLDEDYLERLYTEAKSHNSDLVCSGQKKVTESGKVLAVLSYPIINGKKCILRRLNISGKIYKREYVEKHQMRFALGKTYEDDPFNLVMLFLARNFRILKYEGYNQLVREGSITSRKISIDKIPFEALEDSISYVIDHKNELNDYEIFEYTVLSFFTYFIFQANKKHLYLKKGKERKSDCEVVLEFCNFTIKILKKYMPEYYKNSNVKFWKNKELDLLQRLGVWLYVKLCRFGFLNIFTKIYYKL